MVKHYCIGFSLVFTALALLGPARENKLQKYTFAEVHMGTEFRLVFYAPNDAVARKAANAAFARIAKLNDIMSDYDPTSELRQLCEKSGGPPVKVSRDLFTVLSRAQILSKKTNGAFDVTIGPVVRLWRKSRRTRRLPDEERLKAALKKVGYQKVRLDSENFSVQLLVEGMMLDLGGIAKGYAAEAALEVLRSFGINRALVAAGGDIAVRRPPPGKKGWIIGIGRLRKPDARPKHYLLMKNGAVSTSGDVEQFVEINDKRYSHIVDPKTGLGLLGRSSTTVIAKDGTASDSLATAISILGPEKGKRLLPKTKGLALFVVRENKEGKLETIESKSYQEYQLSPEEE